LPAYIADFNEILRQHDMECVHYAHAGSGELHLRPVLNLKTEQGQADFRLIAEEIAALVKKYQGSLSGEHGDGRLRGEFIRTMIGEANYERLRQVKQLWDPEGIFNPGKIVDAPKMDTSLRFQPNQSTPQPVTLFNWEANQGIVRAAELCNGSGDCRKTQLIGGTMCPSFQATRNEQDTTRARANVLREYLNSPPGKNEFDHPEIKEVLDLCLSCKGCKKECPSNVDMAKLKAEYTYQYQQLHGVPLRSKLMANVNRVNRLAAPVAGIYNALANSTLGAAGKSMIGFHPKRSLPKLHRTTVRKWYERNYRAPEKPIGELVFFCDEFTNYLDAPIGITAIKLWQALGYHVHLPKVEESGRAHISKGLLKEAKVFAEANVRLLAELVTEACPLVGLEPSALLTFRDEYPDLVDKSLRGLADKLASNAILFEEYMAAEIDGGRLKSESFSDAPLELRYHGHCYQKALSNLIVAKKTLNLPANFETRLIPSGCCGMAGSFGYEKEHYEVSMAVGELVLFPTVRQQEENVVIVAPGHSCRHQIHDGTQKQALHPAEVLWRALK
ncbi:MAG TPA: FAD-binding oxidoreductase, partial [Cytophagales bacterium]|nr:FAD-binding oxidoreductase [Cytophagales bacterium]